MRGQGHERDRRVSGKERRDGVSSLPSSPMASWSAGVLVDRLAARAPRRGSLTVFGAASLKGGARAGQDRVRGGIPRHDGHALDRFVRRARDPDRAGRAGRRVPLGRHHEPQEARRRRVRLGRGRGLRRQRAHDHRAHRQPGWRHVADRTSRRTASRSSRPATRCRSRSTPGSSSTTSPEESGYPADFAEAYAKNVVSNEDNVKAVVTKVELGEGDAGVVYVTDATASGKVETVEVPDAANVPASLRGRRRQGLEAPGRREDVPRLARWARPARRSSRSSGSCRPPNDCDRRGSAGRRCPPRDSGRQVSL